MIDDSDTVKYPLCQPGDFNGTKYPVSGVISYPNSRIQYTLPATGGIGNDRVIAVGLAMMAAALIGEYVLWRTRRERRVRGNS